MRSSVQSVQGALSKVWILETRPIVRLYISLKIAPIFCAPLPQLFTNV